MNAQPHTIWATGPNAGKRKLLNGPRIDPAALKVEKNVPLPSTRAKQKTRYTDLFNSMAFGDSIPCEPEDTNAIAGALRQHLKVNKLQGQVVSTRRYKDSGKGRVFWEAPAKAALRRAA